MFGDHGHHGEVDAFAEAEEHAGADEEGHGEAEGRAHGGEDGEGEHGEEERFTWTDARGDGREEHVGDAVGDVEGAHEQSAFLSDFFDAPAELFGELRHGVGDVEAIDKSDEYGDKEGEGDHPACVTDGWCALFVRWCGFGRHATRTDRS